MNLSRIYVFVVLTIICTSLYSQALERGVPQIRNFSTADYRQESQNFSVVQDHNSLLYFGNANGIMEFDNEKWRITKIAGKPKLAISSDNKVYFGGYNVIGRVVKSNGKFEAHNIEVSMNDEFGQILRIVTAGENVYFASSKHLFYYSHDSLRVLINNIPFSIFELSGKIYVQKRGEVLMQLDGDFFQKDALCYSVDTMQVVDMINTSAGNVIINQRNTSKFYKYDDSGLQFFHTAVDRFVQNNEFACFTSLANGTILVGTRNAGLVAIDNAGRFCYILNTSNGLCDNTINEILVDSMNRVWLATENGISLLETNSHLSFFDAASGLRGSVISVIRHNGQLYVGTTVGLYFYRNIENEIDFTRRFFPIFRIIDNCWQLTTFNGELYAVTSSGLFLVNGWRAERVIEGAFQSFKELKLGDRNVVLLGGKNGLELLEIEKNKLVSKGKFINMPYKVRTIVAEEDGRVWLGTDADGLFSIDFSDSISVNSNVRNYNYGNGFDCEIGWIDVVCSKKFGTIFSTSVGVFNYDKSGDKFVKDTNNFGKEKFATSVFTPICEDGQQNIWYSSSCSEIYEREIGVMYEMTSGEHYTLPFGQMKESVVEVIYPESSEIVWFGTSGALIKYENRQLDTMTSVNAFPCLIRRVSVANDSVIYSYGDSDECVYSVAFADKKIRFEVAGLSYNTFGNIEYRFMLVGFDDDWSEWTTESYKEYTSLAEGDYSFRVLARNGYGQTSELGEFSFVVTPPYYRTVVAYILYVLGVILIVLIIIAYRNISHRREKYRLEKLVEQRTNELAMQKEQTESLVKKLLPQNAVNVIAKKKKNTTDKIDMATVLFSDIQGFTRIASTTNADDLIKKLDNIFVAFDNIISKYNIEKIKTIGDAYMCAGGMPNRDLTNPVEVVLAGLEMQRQLSSINADFDVKMNMRLGIHTGPVVAGIIGSKKIEYDIWGDTVNIASRMESHGVVGKVNISEETYNRVKDFFVCTSRGKIEVKGKGMMEMYFVESILPELSENGDGITPNHLFNVRCLNLNFTLIQDEILEQMQRDLLKNLYYHNLKHTIDTIYRVSDIGIKENVSEEDLLLLRCAALFHDSGFMVSYDNNEEIGAKLAHQTLAKYNFSREQIDIIKDIIMVTRIPQQPHTLLEMIMCDADLDYLGRPDFIPISHNLFRELFERGKIDTIEEWNKMQYNFILKHKYFTNTAKANGEPGKLLVLKELKEMI